MIVKKPEFRLANKSYRVEIYRSVLDWYVAEPVRSIEMSRNMAADLTRIFGKPSGTYTGNGTQHKVWSLEFEGHSYQVFCSKRGTSIEAEGEFLNLKSQADSHIRFLEELYRTIKNK
jgi:cobalamin biosynthesis Mg chelatase CobN